MDTREFAERILLNLPYDPNHQQIELIAALARFCSADTPDDSVFLLAGYAGTGKTSLIGALVKALREAQIQSVLLAPTGRAAKVFSSFSSQAASTIHRRIYHSSEPGVMNYAGDVSDNPFRNAVFIVDEASMIGDTPSGDNSSGLLEDLIQYVYSGERCRLILLGDIAQLPPVGSQESPAMMVSRLKAMGLRVTRAIITETVRQARDSGILFNATWLRQAMRKSPLPEPEITVKGFDDVCVIDGEELADCIADSYREAGIDNTIVVTRSNMRAKLFNLAIRTNILDREEELTRDERILIAKNNYLWSSKVKGLDFIANGDMATVDQIFSTEERYGFRFANVRLIFPYRDVSVECKIILDTLVSDSHALDNDSLNRLAMSCLQDNEKFTPDMPMRQRMNMLKSDPYFNALQVKYAYAVTCHKAQGGQWSDVYVDMAYIPPEAQGLDFYRWLYTATTRATKRLFYVNPTIKVIGSDD